MANKVKTLILFAIICLSFVQTSKTQGEVSIVLELNMMVSNPTDLAIAFQLKEQWKKIGIDLDVRYLEWASLMGNVFAKTPGYQLAILNVKHDQYNPDAGVF